MQRLAIIGLLLCLFSSCRQAEETFSKEELAKQDSLALHVAVFPTLETLPLYYAEKTGMLAEAGNDIRLAQYESMMDCDTAICRGYAEVTFTDVARIIMLKSEQNYDITPIATTVSTLGLYSPKEKKINRIQQLKERLVAMERHSQSDYWSDKILVGKDLTTLDIFRVQIGSTPLRYEMLCGGLVDAAFLPQPYSLLCDTTLTECVWKQPEDATSWTVIGIPTKQKKDSRRSMQVKTLLDVYEKARRKIVAHPDTAILHNIYRETFRIPERQLKRVHWYEWHPAPLDTTQYKKAQQEAEEWLHNERNRYL